MLFIAVLFSMFSQLSYAGPTDHQIGQEFGKTLIDRTSLSNDTFFKNNPFAVKMAEATAWLTHPVHGALKERDPLEKDKINCQKTKGMDHEDCKKIKTNHGRYIGSAHLVGEFEGKLIMFTNSHLVHEKMCGAITLQFVFLEGAPMVKCKELILRDERLDFAMIEVTTEDEKFRKELSTKGINLAYDTAPVVGDALYTIGFSHHNTVTPDDILNGLDPLRIAQNKAYLTRDSDCKVLSNKVKLIRNPKKETEAFKPRHAYSFATGCDAFLAGDCGAMYIKESTNEIIGMYWSEGAEPKIETIGTDNLWQSATYGAPAMRIKSLAMTNPLSRESDYKKLFEAIFGAKK